MADNAQDSFTSPPKSAGKQDSGSKLPFFLRPTLNSIRQTDVDTLMILTQSRVRVRVRVRVGVGIRVIYLNQTHQILGSVGVRVMHSRSNAPSSNPTHFILNCFFSLKIEDTLTFMYISSRNFI